MTTLLSLTPVQPFLFVVDFDFDFSSDGFAVLATNEQSNAQRLDYFSARGFADSFNRLDLPNRLYVVRLNDDGTLIPVQ